MTYFWGSNVKKMRNYLEGHQHNTNISSKHIYVENCAMSRKYAPWGGQEGYHVGVTVTHFGRSK